jgi:TRAP-type C4-dicarboxylate transport system substrate-binding protein
MHSMKRESCLAMLGFVVVVAIVATSCSTASGGDKAGGSGEPVVLRMATVNGDLAFTPQIQYLADRVDELSEGNVQIEIVYEVGSFAPVAEQQVVRGVAGGKFDLGFVGTHVFESLGVTSLRALTAPMLIDSYALEDAVIESGITDQMLQGIDDVGVTGLKVLAGALRKPIAVKKPLLGPADWRGISFGIFKSEAQAEAVRALAAAPLQVIGDPRDEALEDGSIDGFESSLLAYHINGQERAAPYGTANVNLWPQTLAVVGNPDVIADLTAEQQGWLQQAAGDAAERSAALVDTDARNLRMACDAGARFADASETNLVALQDALAAAYVKLQQDPQTKAHIEKIQVLKQSTRPEPAPMIPPDCTGEAPSHDTTSTGTTPEYLNGVYRRTITKQDAIAGGFGDDPDYPSTDTLWLDDGSWRMRGPDGGNGGTYWVNRDEISFESFESVGNENTFTFTRDDEGNLTLEPVPPMEPGDAALWVTKPWIRIG